MTIVQGGMIIFPLSKRERLEALIDAAITASEAALRQAGAEGNDLARQAAADDIEEWEELRSSIQIVEATS